MISCYNITDANLKSAILKENIILSRACGIVANRKSYKTVHRPL